jgi:hypothetical protein
MFKKALTIALAIMLVSAVTAFACGGDKTASKTADVQKASSEKYACGDKDKAATVKSASVDSDKKAADCPYMKAAMADECTKDSKATVKTAAVTGDKKSCDVKKASADYNCTESKDASVKKASAEKSGCSYDAKDASKKATDDKKEIDVSKTAMADEK